MIFQTFDEKDECLLVYQNKRFHNSFKKLKLTHTWSYASYLKDKNIQYAQIWAQGSPLSQECPQSVKKEFIACENKLKALIRSCNEAKIDLNEVCIFDFCPPHILEQYAEIKNKICSYVFSNHTKPENYAHMLNLTKVITDIKYRDLKLDLNTMRRVSVKDRNNYRNLSNCNKRVVYDIYKTKTGRLSTVSHSFPVLTLPKEYRGVLKPENDWLFELDYNAAELRVLLGLLGQAQPVDDVHKWSVDNVYDNKVSREEAKKRTFAWLYNPESEDEQLNQRYDRDTLLKKYWDGTNVKTLYNREISADRHHALNYIIQSTTADMVFEQMYKVWEFLRDKKTFIKFCNHDSIMIDLSEEDQEMVNDIKEIFSETRFGKFKINCMGGKDWGAMKELYIR